MPIRTAVRGLHHAWQAATYRLPEQSPMKRAPEAQRPIRTRWHCILKVQTPDGGWVVAARSYFDWPATDHRIVQAEIEARARAVQPDLAYRCLATPA